MNKTMGFIGSGNMGRAIIGGILQSSIVPLSAIIASDALESALTTLKSTYNIHTTTDNIETAKAADILFLAVKPHIYPAVIEQIKGRIKQDAVVVSMAAGRSIAYLEKLFEKPVKLVRIMPNTPALVREGMIAVCPNAHVGEADLQTVLTVLKVIGVTEVVDEGLMDVVTAISGSSPAYVYVFIEAMADAAVAEGMPRDSAYKFAAQAVLGAAKMVLQTGEHPGVLKDQVCSPGGTTIRAVCELEKQGMRNAVISAMRVCTEKSRQMAEAAAKLHP